MWLTNAPVVYYLVRFFESYRLKKKVCYSVESCRFHSVRNTLPAIRRGLFNYEKRVEI